MPEICAVDRGELEAFVRQGYLIAKNSVRPYAGRNGLRRDRVVLVVHGLFAAGGVFEPLRKRIERECGLRTFDFTYSPLRAFEDVARDLARAFDQIAQSGAQVSIVGHSLGGLVARWLVQELKYAPRVDRIVTLATPHAGTTLARLGPTSLIRAIQPSSKVMRALRDSSGELASIRCVAMGADGDSMISPTSSSIAWPEAKTQWFTGLGHNAMLFDGRVHDAVVDALSD